MKPVNTFGVSECIFSCEIIVLNNYDAILLAMQLYVAADSAYVPVVILGVWHIR